MYKSLAVLAVVLGLMAGALATPASAAIIDVHYAFRTVIGTSQTPEGPIPLFATIDIDVPTFLSAPYSGILGDGTCTPFSGIIECSYTFLPGAPGADDVINFQAKSESRGDFNHDYLFAPGTFHSLGTFGILTISGTDTGDDGGPTGVPEPSTWALMLAGFGALCASLRRTRTRRTRCFARVRSA